MQINTTTLSRLQDQAHALESIINRMQSSTEDHLKERLQFRMLELISNLESIRTYKPALQFQHTQAARLEQLLKGSK